HYLPTLTTLFGPLNWESLLFTDTLRLQPPYDRRFHKEAFVILHFVRAIIWRQLWLHRTAILLDGDVPNTITVAHEVRTYLELHLLHYHTTLKDRPDFRRLRRLLDLWMFCGPAFPQPPLHQTPRYPPCCTPPPTRPPPSHTSRPSPSSISSPHAPPSLPTIP
ncbi:hypothetical protein H310_13732, partial [Aphanomyces invadans]